jgi:hypothetical protein
MQQLQMQMQMQVAMWLREPMMRTAPSTPAQSTSSPA